MRAEKDKATQRRAVIDNLVSSGYLKDQKVIKAMLKVPREEFLPANLKDSAYIDTPLYIGHGQTISAIHMVAMMDDALELGVGQRVLEVGSGSGYHCATIAEIVAPSHSSKEGHVFTVEVVPELAKFAEDNLRKAGYEDVVTVIRGDGSVGYPVEAPYDRILATAAAPKVPPLLVDQLKPGGILVVPIGSFHTYQDLVLVKKLSDGKLLRKDLGGVVFVPMVGEHGWRA
ncbi:protein-L-isoaspartate O-methyltransferase [Candidatus Bathyarchaeota archaeon RBG_16_48_13]|nr:MAG: protein-L-isoaspartate O-methyltransferase [Candidatus Bathyarchaeota archaeon RBG_16_48_13]